MLERFAASRQSAASFCASESIGLGTLRRWRQATSSPARAITAATPSGFLDVGALGSRLTIEVDLGGGVVLRVQRG